MYKTRILSEFIIRKTDGRFIKAHSVEHALHKQVNGVRKTQDSQRMYNVSLRRVLATIVAVGKRELLHTLGGCL
jgi:hypothetical protein